MILFPKLPALRGKRAVYEVNGFVSTLAANPHWRPSDPGQKFEGDRIHLRTADRTILELRVLDFIKRHEMAVQGRLQLERVDNNGYHLTLATWTRKSPEPWKQAS